MSENEKNEPHRIDRGLVHPAVELAAHLALTVYADRTSTISADAFERLVQGISVQPRWADLDLNLETAALMTATALHLQAVLGSMASLSAGSSPSDPAAAEANIRAQQTMEAVSALSLIADQFGGVSRA